MKILCVVLKTNFQIERYLGSLNSNDEVVVLSPTNLVEKIEKAYKKRFNINTIISYENKNEIFNIQVNDSKLIDKVKETQCDKAVIPFTINTKPIKFIPHSHMSSIHQFYVLTTFLHKSGLCSVELYDMGTITTLNTPMIVEEFINKHQGQRAFVIGNGPSLNNIDMSRLKDEVTFGSNRVHLGFKKWGYSFKYWAIVDKLQLEEHLYEWESKVPEETVKFFPFEYMPVFNFKQNYCPMNFHYGYPGHEDNPKFDADPYNQYLGFTVTHTLLQLAVIMGCNPIYLLGVDHNYNAVDEKDLKAKKETLLSKITARLLKKDRKAPSMEEYLQKHIWKASDTKEQTHFDSSYNDPKAGRRFVIPRPEKSEKAFENARIWADERNIKIYNATPGSKLNVFERQEFIKIFED